MATSNDKLAQEIVDNLNWNVLREYYEDNKDAEEFKSMSQSEIEQWFLKEVNTPLIEQGLTLKTIDEIRELLNRPYSILFSNEAICVKSFCSVTAQFCIFVTHLVSHTMSHIGFLVRIGH
jgi:response regulator of citrate/malate metabolism